MSARGAMERVLLETWSGRRPWLSHALVPASLAWGLGSGADRLLHRWGVLKVARAAVPVVSVGNLVAGGAGKTPATLVLAERLLAAGRRVAVLSRGYGRRSDARVVLVSDGVTVRAAPDEGGDEPVWLARRCPGLVVVVATKRIDAAERAVEHGADLLLLDDGLSHHALHRDADVVVVDATEGLGNGRMLPAGPLRLPASAAKDAALVWLSKCATETDPVPDALADRPVVRTRYVARELVDLALNPADTIASLRERRVVAVCGIARPASFERTLQSLGANVRHVVAFPDHHRFTREDVEAIEREAERETAELVVTTEKDAVRLAQVAPVTFARAVRMDVEVIGDGAALDGLVRRFAPHAGGVAA